MVTDDPPAVHADTFKCCPVELPPINFRTMGPQDTHQIFSCDIGLIHFHAGQCPGASVGGTAEMGI